MLNRPAAALATVVAAVLVGAALAPPAAADGGLSCNSVIGKCSVSAGKPGRPGSPGGPAQPRENGPGRGQGAQRASAPACTESHRATRASLCTSGARLPAAETPEQGPPPPTPAEVAQSAIAELALAAPDIRLAPPGGVGLVGAPVWMWTGARAWAPVSRTAAVAGVSVTATATPTRTTWSMGDGQRITCTGPGTPYTARHGAKASPDCGHTYTAPSQGAYRITATTHWAIRWAGAGDSGSDAMARRSATTLRISEGQGLIQ